MWLGFLAVHVVLAAVPCQAVFQCTEDAGLGSMVDCLDDHLAATEENLSPPDIGHLSDKIGVDHTWMDSVGCDVCVGKSPKKEKVVKILRLN